MADINEIKEIVENTDNETLQNFVVNLLSEDENLVTRLKLLSSNQLTKEDLNQYKKKYQQIVNPNVERGSFVPPSKARRMNNQLYEFISDEMMGLVQRKYFEEAFNITKMIFLRLNSLNIGGSEDDTDFTLKKLFEVWQQILNTGPKTMETKMFRWAVNRQKNEGNDISDEQLRDFLFENFNEPNQQERKLQVIKQKIEEIKEENTGHSLKVILAPWTEHYLALAMEMNMGEGEVDQFIEDHLFVDEVREFAVQQHIGDSEFDQAIQLLEERKEEGAIHPASLRKYSNQLKELYKLTKDTAAYKEELWELITKIDHSNLEHFNELKSLYTEEEWEEKREEIFEALPEHAILGDYYRNEGLYPRILEFVQESGSRSQLEAYEDDLKGRYPEEMLDAYEKIALRSIKVANERRLYREVVQLLRQMSAYTGGKERVDALIEEWKVEYKHRPAMIEELEKI